MEHKRQRGRSFTAIDNRFFFFLFRYLTGQSMEVYAYLCCHARDRGEMGNGDKAPTVARISEESGIGNKAISRAIAQLEHYGFIKRRRTVGGNSYTFPSYDEVEERCFARLRDEGVLRGDVSKGHEGSVESTQWDLSKGHDGMCRKDTGLVLKGHEACVESTHASINKDIEDVKDVLPAPPLAASAPIGTIGKEPDKSPVRADGGAPAPRLDAFAPTGATGGGADVIPVRADGDAPAPSGGGPHPRDAVTRRRSVVSLDPTRWSPAPKKSREEGICSPPLPAAPPATIAPVVPDPPATGKGARPLTIYQEFLEAWCAAFDLDWRDIVSVGPLMQAFKRWHTQVGLTVEELPALLEYHRRTRAFMYRGGAPPTVRQIEEAIPDWRANRDKPDPEVERRLAAVAEMAKTLMY